MRPKFLVILLVVALSLTLISCGRGGGGKGTDTAPSPNTTNRQDDSPAQTPPPTANPDQGSTSTPARAPESKEETAARTSIAGIHLGDSRDDVKKILGNKYKETVNEEPAYYGEGQYIWKYDQGIEIVIGKDSLKVLDITVYTPVWKTNLGAKVGDSAKDVLAKYRAKYKEPQSRHGEGTLQGWFEVEDGGYLIFDFDKSDGSLVNRTIKNDSRVEMIKLIHSFYLD
ncbi:MAG: hypothetical protein PWP70_864 [Moorella sp. (in: firmicutes)]|nr:hypothetical protein [Moorella sp. (in: firmicutes)]